MHQNQIGRGAVVDFDTQEGPQRGTVTNMFEDITNKRILAEIRVPNTMNGAPWLMAVADLHLARAPNPGAACADVCTDNTVQPS